MSGVNVEVDVLIGAYAYTRRHLVRLFELARRLNLGDMTNMANGEDVPCFPGSDVRKFTMWDKSSAVHQPPWKGWPCRRTLNDFWDERVNLFERTRAARKGMDSLIG